MSSTDDSGTAHRPAASADGRFAAERGAPSAEPDRPTAPPVGYHLNDVDTKLGVHPRTQLVARPNAECAELHALR